MRFRERCAFGESASPACSSPRDQTKYCRSKFKAGASALAQPQKNKLRIVVVSSLEFAKAFGRGESRLGGFFRHDQCIRRQPAAGARGVERGGRQSLAVGRV